MNIKIRNEQMEEYFEVENVIREAFWDVYKPGCEEHLILHQLRKKDTFIWKLDCVVEISNRIVASIAYSKGYVLCDSGEMKEHLTFGPIGVLPEYQRIGIGKKLIEDTLQQARELGYEAVFITGSSKYYHRFGFEPASKYQIYLEGMSKKEEAPFFMVKVLKENALEKSAGVFQFDSCFEVELKQLEEFELQFPRKEKGETK